MAFAGEDGIAAVSIIMYLQFLFIGVYSGFSMGWHLRLDMHMEIKILMYAVLLRGMHIDFFSIAPIVIYALTFFSGTNVCIIFLPINIAVYIHWRISGMRIYGLGLFDFPELTSSQQYV